MHTGGQGNEARISNLLLWVVQWSLALLFLWAGGLKLVLSLDSLAGPVALWGWFVRFVGLAETLGALGLILPWLLRIKPILTPLAATGLVIVMIGATVVTLIGGSGATVVTLIGGSGAFSLFPAAVGILAACVAYGRWRAAPQRVLHRRG